VGRTPSRNFPETQVRILPGLLARASRVTLLKLWILLFASQQSVDFGYSSLNNQVRFHSQCGSMSGREWN
jgi:hypothetical protein